MPKKTAQRIIDSRRTSNVVSISGITLTGGSSGTSDTLAGAGLTYTDGVIDVGAGTLITVGADSVGVTDGANYQYVGTGSGTAAAWQNLSTLAGAGLTHSAGVLAVGAGTLITVGADTVGITAGSNYQFIGTGSGTAAAWQNLSTLAGAGLTHSAGVLAVGAGDGITVSADAVALTTPGTLTVSTTNSASSSHTHAITSSANPGANARILASTASGGLTLQSLAVQGSVDVTNGGDLTVAGSGSYAGNSVLFVDSSGGNVGIMGAPDPQFALDVVGPCRASWFVGPHAIQLKDVLILSHFDGRQPFESNFTGEPNGHMGQIATVAGGAIHRTGKFGTKAIQIAEGTTNLCTNPSFETGTTGWTYQDANASGTAARTQLYVYTGSYSVRLSNANSGEDDYYWFNVTGLSASTAYTITAMANVVSFSGGATSNRGLYCYDTADAGGTAQGTTITAISDGWTRHTVTVTTTAAGGSHTIQIRLYAPGGYVAWDSIQVEAKAYATNYCDGSMGSGHTWSGTAHASTSTRTAATLTYSTTGNVNINKGTIMAWVWLHDVDGTYDVLRIDGSSAGLILLRVASNALVGYWGTAAISSGGTLSPHTWHHVAMTYSAGTLTTFLDGVQVSTGSSSGFSGLPATMGVGSVSGGGNYINGFLDDFVITESAMDADGILAVYESDAPVFAESSRFSFRATPQGLVWADDEGLWMRNSTGGTVLGAYGSDSTKSWAGVTLSPSDVVIGDSARGAYMLWDDSAGTLAIGKSGANNSYINITGADIAIYQNSVARIVANGSGSLTLRDTAGTAQVTLSGSGTILVGETGASKTNVYIASGAISLRVNTTERIGLSSAGVLTVKDSGGAAVFTLDASAGAEFTKPLTIGTSGGIYQGTGTFASPTTGLKIWNDSGVGRIGGYNAGTLQWYASTNGYFYSGSGTMRIGSDDIRLTLGTYDGDYEDYRTIKWVPTIDGTDSSRQSFDYRSDITTWGDSDGGAVTLSLTTRVNAGDYDTRDAKLQLRASNYNGSTLNYGEIELVCKDSASSYETYASFVMDYLLMQRTSGTTTNPPSGYYAVWFDSSNNRLYVRDSGGTNRYVTFS